MGKIIAIHSLRGGTGKTNLCANLSAQLALAGYRVALVDADLLSPGLHVLFGLDQDRLAHTLNEYLHDQATIEQVAHPLGKMEHTQPGLRQLAGKKLWLYPASHNTSAIARLFREGYDVGLFNDGLQEMHKYTALNYVFIDTHPGLGEETLLSIAVSDVLILVMRPDQQDLQDTAMLVDVARKLDVPEIYLLVNKVPSNIDPEQLRKTIEDRYNIPVAGVLPLSEELAELGSADLFSLRYPEHPWSQRLRELTQLLLPK